jgi:hypothetical protein
VARAERKNADQGTTISPPKSNLVAVADPPKTQNLTPAPANQSWDVIVNWRSLLIWS